MVEGSYAILISISIESIRIPKAGVTDVSEQPTVGAEN